MPSCPSFCSDVLSGWSSVFEESITLSLFSDTAWLLSCGCSGFVVLFSSEGKVSDWSSLVFSLLLLPLSSCSSSCSSFSSNNPSDNWLSVLGEKSTVSSLLSDTIWLSASGCFCCWSAFSVSLFSSEGEVVDWSLLVFSDIFLFHMYFMQISI